MYPKFIEVRDADQGCMLSLNVTNICGFNEYCDDADKTVIAMTDGVFHVVDHTYEDIRQMITESGCLIRKQDPRLDTEHPLTMKDLKGMVGEPVWNSNTRKWYIIHSVGNTVAMANPSEQSMLVYIKSDLSKYPIYRMKVVGGR